MGNAVPLRMCRGKAAVASAGRRRRPKNAAATEAAAPYAAAPRRASVMPLKQRDDAEQAETTRARRVSRAGGAGDDAAAADKAPTATVATVKIVLRRKDAEALVARLNAQSARERKDRMAEIKGELRAGECCGGGGASPVPAWRPRLAPINEN